MPESAVRGPALSAGSTVRPPLAFISVSHLLFQARAPQTNGIKMRSVICCSVFLVAVATALAGPAQAGRHPETLRQGDPAPDFTLHSPDGKKTVHLADLRGAKPVVLIFGSYTCPPFRDVYPALEKLYATYGEHVAFYYIYIREAHAEDGWKMKRNQREGIAIKDPKTMEERTTVATQACAFFKTQIPGLVDTMDDKTDRAYAAWPSRIFVVDTSGKIAVCGEPGPRGLVPAARAAEAWLRQHAGNPAR
jgi:thiol-disulfide isomerase/thioredoxin